MRHGWRSAKRGCCDDEPSSRRTTDETLSESVERLVRDKFRGSERTAELVRNIVEHTFELVDDVIKDSERLAKHTFGRGVREASRPSHATAREPSPDEVLAWQDAVLNKNAVCVICNAILPKGTRAAFGVLEGSGPRPVACLEHASDPSDDREKPAPPPTSKD